MKKSSDGNVSFISKDQAVALRSDALWQSPNTILFEIQEYGLHEGWGMV